MTHFFENDTSGMNTRNLQKQLASYDNELPATRKRIFRGTTQSGFYNSDQLSSKHLLINPSLSYRILALEEEE